jgi:hypothetical protein
VGNEWRPSRGVVGNNEAGEKCHRLFKNRSTKKVSVIPMPSDAFPSVFLNKVEAVVFNPVQQWSNHDLWVSEAKSFDFTHDKVHFVTNFEHRCEVKEVFFGRLRLPSRPFHQALDELIFPRNQVYHPALSMSNQSDATNSADGNCIGDFEFAVPQISAASPNNKCEIVRNMKVLPVVHTHPDQQLGACVQVKLSLEIMVFEQPPDRGFPVLRRDVFPGCDR